MTRDGSRYPLTIVTTGGQLQRGFLSAPLKVCSQCPDRRCRDLYSRAADLSTGKGLVFERCYRNVLAGLVDLGREKVVVPGIHVDPVASALAAPARREPSAISKAVVQDWASREMERQRSTDVALESAYRAAGEILHDVQTSGSSLVRTAEAFLKSQAGHDDDARLEALAPEARNLLNAVQLVRFRILTAPILANPAAASLGTKRKRPIYRVVDFLRRTLAPNADNAGVRIILRGPSTHEVPVYDAFDALPLNLLDNAIKYTKSGETIEVQVSDQGSQSVSVNVSSMSPYIPEEDRTTIFERGGRSEAAKVIRPEGSGLGLHIATVVALAHGTVVKHTCDMGNLVHNGVRYCRNEFYFRIG